MHKPLSQLKPKTLCNFIDSGFPNARRINLWRVCGRRKPKIVGNRTIIPISMYGFKHIGTDGQSEWTIKDTTRKKPYARGYVDDRCVVVQKTRKTFFPKKEKYV